MKKWLVSIGVALAALAAILVKALREPKEYTDEARRQKRKMYEAERMGVTAEADSRRDHARIIDSGKDGTTKSVRDRLLDRIRDGE